MNDLLASGTILDKTKTLCQTILEQPEFQATRRNIDLFMADNAVRQQYDDLSERGQALQHRQQTGGMVDANEISEFEKARDSFLANPVARGFLDAQQAMHHLHESVNKYLTLTFELGRVPQESDLEEGGCGSGGCGCKH